MASEKKVTEFLTNTSIGNLLEVDSTISKGFYSEVVMELE